MSGPTMTVPSALNSIPGTRRRKLRVGVLAQREHDRVGLELLELAGRVRPALLVQLHHLDRQRRAGDLFDAGQPLDLDALLERLVGLERVRRHVGAVAAVDDQRLFGAEALGRSRRIHGGVAAAVDHHAATEARLLADAHAAQQAHGVEHAGDVARRDVDVFRDMGADRDEHGIEAAVRQLGEQVLDLVIEDDAHAHVLDPPNFLHEVFPRQAVGGNAEMHHAARQRAGFVDLDCMTQSRQVIGGGEAARAGADHQHALAAGGPRIGGFQPCSAARSPRKRSTAWMLTDASRSLRLQPLSHGW